MIANYGICAQCSELIENKSIVWRDIDGHSFSLKAKDDGFVYHVHSPIQEGNYSSLGKYSCLDAEILDALAMEGYASDSVGDQSTIGFYDLFSDYRAILTSHTDGSVTVNFYGDDNTVNVVWRHIMTDCAIADDEPLYDEYGDDEYAYESGAYNSDLWD
jgi:hypothetical protein